MIKIMLATVAALSLATLTAAPVSAGNGTLRQYAQAKSSDGQSTENVDMAAIPKLDSGKIRRVQQALKDKGFDPGPVNGTVGDKTKAAVKQFQERFGITASGEIDNQTLFALGVVGDNATAAEKEPPPKMEAKPSKTEPAAKKPTKRTQRKQPQRAAKPHKKQVWCASYRNGGRNCGFSNQSQCLAAVSGEGGSCYQQ